MTYSIIGINTNIPKNINKKEVLNNKEEKIELLSRENGKPDKSEIEIKVNENISKSRINSKLPGTNNIIENID
jgi:hypothetical protein